MRATPNRTISDEEAECVRITLEKAATIPDAIALIPSIAHLRVVGGCECGCASVGFVKEQLGVSQPIADGTGKTALGGGVGIIVWGANNLITALEVYDLGAGDDDLNLPVPNSIVSWDHTEA